LSADEILIEILPSKRNLKQNSSKIPIRISVGQAAGYAYLLKTDAAKIIVDTLLIR